MKVQNALQLASAGLRNISTTPALDAIILLEAVMKLDRSKLEAHPELPLSLWQNLSFRQKLRRRKRGLPVAYLTSHKEFFGLDFFVNPQVLIPRPDTEVLVQEALNFLKDNPQTLILELGTGSGCISCAIASHCRTCKIIAGDISKRALKIARHNVGKLALNQRVKLVRSDLLDSLPYRESELIIANLPYIRSSDYAKLDPQIRKFEPRLALEAGPDGLFYYRKLLNSLQNWNGILLLEIADQEQAESLKNAYPNFKFQEIPDLAGCVRVLKIRVGN